SPMPGDERGPRCNLTGSLADGAYGGASVADDGSTLLRRARVRWTHGSACPSFARDITPKCSTGRTTDDRLSPRGRSRLSAVAGTVRQGVHVLRPMCRGY